MQIACTVRIMLVLFGVSRLIGRGIPLPLPLLWIAAGALLAWRALLMHRLQSEALMNRCLGSCDVQRHHRIGDDVLREMLRKLDLSQADLGVVKWPITCLAGAVVCIAHCR